MTTTPWRCSDCGTSYVVPTLARDCETRHQDHSPTS